MEVETNTSEPLYVTFYFDKTGSTSMRAILGSLLPSDFVGSFHGAGGGRYGHCCQPARPAIVTRYAMARDASGPESNWDCCAVVAPRPCRYVTLMRRPIDRLVSAYNYFCLSCAEFGRQCGSQRPDILTCPDMAIHEYADAWRDIYTRALSHHDYGKLDLMSYRSTERDFDEARRWLLEHNPFVLFVEDFGNEFPFRGLGAFLDRSVLANVSFPPHTNSQAGYGLVAPPSLMQRLEEEYLYWDTKLYNWLRTEYVQPPPAVPGGPRPVVDEPPPCND